MKRIARIAVAVAAAFALTSTALAATPAEQPAAQEFSALDGIDAQALDALEMDAIHGALTGQDIFNALLAKAQLIKDPVLRAKAVSSLLANQTQLVAFFNKLLSIRI